MTIRRAGLMLVILASVTWTTLIIAAPFSVLRADRGIRWQASALVYAAGAIVCHQRSERSFHVATVQWPVCARCSGLYVGSAFGLLLWPIIRTQLGSRQARHVDLTKRLQRLRVVVVVLAAPTIVTVVSAALDLFDPPNTWRAALALPLGAAAGAAVSAVLLEDLE